MAVAVVHGQRDVGKGGALCGLTAPAGRQSRQPAFTVITASCSSPRRVSMLASDSLAWSRCFSARAATESAMLVLRSFAPAMSVSTWPRVVPLQLRSRLVFSLLRRSAYRARMLSMSGDPLCLVSSTMYDLLYTRPASLQANYS